MMFSYAEMTRRNIGFVTVAEQARLKDATVFVCGTGGMGGACLLALARIGVGHLIIADIDEFEVSNLNRQVFAFAETIDRHKAEATRDILLRINPELQITVWRDDWPEHVTEAVAQAAVVVNGTDDLGASLLLYRTARAAGKSVIDAYASPLPSIYVTAPTDTPHEVRLGYPTVGTAWDKLTEDQRSEAFMREAEHVMIHSSSRHYIDLDLVAEVVSGTRSRMSFAPMVITTGQLMAYEVVNAVLGRKRGADNRGWFFNPHAGRVERPKPAWLAAIMRMIVRRFMARMLA
ncbi:HesA/MoeB/ThiF family protein [Flavimaricola marinus]|uniref:Sulfur carrier protein ThiS adenylyltransferase n=1 Tax=Flavimaricola marinus TaxID=1819565 RepID=A0A238LHM8_9RHOB|nr:ThiF family adenylyltransferase [Flavimaricola marinus]SMY09138.1 Sulfur carrier protein ThiS adenylyltransferase [Flavimaricola marinus]